MQVIIHIIIGILMFPITMNLKIVFFIGSVYSSAYAIGFTSTMSGKISKVLMKGCKFNGAIKQDQSIQVGITSLEYEITGYGNELTSYMVESTQNIQKSIYFAEEVQEKLNHNSATITRGTPLRLVYPERVGTMWSGDTTAHFAGLCAKDCSSTDKYVMVRTKVISLLVIHH